MAVLCFPYKWGVTENLKHFMANFCLDFVVGIKLAVVEPLCDTLLGLQCHLEPYEMNVMTSRGFIGRCCVLGFVLVPWEPSNKALSSRTRPLSSLSCLLGWVLTPLAMIFVEELVHLFDSRPSF